MIGQSHAYLSAKLVWQACWRVLEDIARERVEMAYKRDRETFLGWWRREGFVTEDAAESMRQHRAKDEEACRQLMDLARVVEEDGKDMRVYVTASDFAKIKERYRS